MIKRSPEHDLKLLFYFFARNTSCIMVNINRLTKGELKMEEKIKVEAYVESLEPTKADKIKAKLRNAKTKTIDFVKRNKKEIIVMTPVALGVGKAVVKAVKPTQYEKERKRIDETYYDPKTGAHWELKRKLSNIELQRLVARRSNGEDSGTILRDMGLLK